MSEASEASVTLADKLTTTFEAYVVAAQRADRIFLEYKFLRATEGQVQRATRLLLEAQNVHLGVIEQVRQARPTPSEAAPR